MKQKSYFQPAGHGLHQRYLLPVAMCVLFIVIGWADRETLAKTASVQEIKILINNIEKDAESQVAAIHGNHVLSTITVGIEKEFHLNSLPMPMTGDPCPAVGYSENDIGTSIQSKALNRSGVYYIFGVEAGLKGDFIIAKWAFAKASLMAVHCPSNLSNLGFALNMNKDYKHAALILEYAKILDPTDSSIYANLAYSYQHLFRYSDAINEIMIAIAFQPKIDTYKEKLEELKKLKKEKTTFQIIGQGEKNKVPQLEDALDMLEEKKQEKIQKEDTLAFDQTLPYPDDARHMKRNWDVKGTDIISGYDPSLLEMGNTACAYFSRQTHLLTRLGDGLVEKAGESPPGGSPIEKFIATGGNHIKKSKAVVAKIDASSYKTRNDLIRDIASIGALETANIFYGIASEMYDMCGETEPDPDMDQFLNNLIKERENWQKNFFKDLDKEKFSKPVCTYKICIQRGDQGSLRLSVQDGMLGTDIQIHPTNIYKYQCKVSVGGDLLKKTIGNAVTAGIGYSHYFEYKREIESRLKNTLSKLK